MGGGRGIRGLRRRDATDSLGGTGGRAGAAFCSFFFLAAGGGGGSKLLFSPHFGIGVEKSVVVLGVERDLVRMSKCFPIPFSFPIPPSPPLFYSSLLSPPSKKVALACPLSEVVDPQSSSAVPNSIQFRAGDADHRTRMENAPKTASLRVTRSRYVLRLMRIGEERRTRGARIKYLTEGPRRTNR